MCRPIGPHYRRCPKCGGDSGYAARRREMDRARYRATADTRAAAKAHRHATVDALTHAITAGDPITVTDTTPVRPSGRPVHERAAFLERAVPGARITLVEIRGAAEGPAVSDTVGRPTNITDTSHAEDGTLTGIRLADGNHLDLTGKLAFSDGLVEIPDGTGVAVYRLAPAESAPLGAIDTTGLPARAVTRIQKERERFAATVRTSIDAAKTVRVKDVDELRDLLSQYTGATRTASASLDTVEAEQRGVTSKQWQERRDTADPVALSLLEVQADAWSTRTRTLLGSLQRRLRTEQAAAPDSRAVAQLTAWITGVQELHYGLLAEQRLLHSRRQRAESAD